MPWLLSAIPAIILLYMIFRFHVNVPYFDEWAIAELLDKWYRGVLVLGDFWKKHNEHRVFFSKIVIFALARLSSWNLLYEEIFSFLFASASFLFIARLVKKTEIFLAWRGGFLLLPLASLVVFSLRQWENWTWGIELIYYMGVFGSVAGIVVLSDLVFSWRRLWCAALLGVFSIYSYSCGILFWPVAFFLLLFHAFPDKTTKSRVLLLWVLLSTLAIGGCFYDFGHLAKHPPYEYGLENPGEFIRYFFACLGSPLIPDRNAHKMGVVGFLAFVSLSAFLFLKLKKREAYLGYVALGFFSIGNMFFTTIGRSGFGDVQAITSRYVTISYPLWIALIFLSAVTFKVLESGPSGISETKSALLKSSAWILLTIFFSSFLKVSYLSIEPMRARSEFLKKASRELFLLQDDSLLKLLHPNPELVRKLTPMLREKRLALFHDSTHEPI